MWGLGAAGVDVPLTVHHQGSAHHEGVTFDVTVTSTDRFKLLKAPRLHYNSKCTDSKRGSGNDRGRGR